MRSLTPLLLILALPCAAQDGITSFWSGALTPTSINIRARSAAPMQSLRVAYCASPCASGYAFSAPANADPANDHVASIALQGLQPDQVYTYRFELDGVLDESPERTGRFRTPAAGPCSYSFVLGSCNGFGLHPVWEAMRNSDPLFFLCTGDLHYRDPNSIDLEQHRAPYTEEVHQWAPMTAFLHDVPIAYVWDDHDFCGNGSDASSIGKANAARAYREHVPHYPLVHETSIHQAFTIGRVHFILSDLRSSKSSDGMMDLVQYTWLLQQFLHARDNGLVAAWVSSLTWNSVGWPENWACQPDERAALNDFLFAQQVQDLFVLSGDAHMLAIDDGANADFSTAQSLAFHYPIFQAAAISRFGSYKGGNFNQGGVHPNPFPWHGQFGEVKVEDDGHDVCITFSGLRTDSMSASVQLVNSYTFCRAGVAGNGGAEHAQPSAIDAWYVHGAGLQVRGASPSLPVFIRIADAQGRLLKHARIAAAPEPSWLALHDLSAGMYTAEIVQGNARATLRFVRTEGP